MKNAFQTQSQTTPKSRQVRTASSTTKDNTLLVLFF